jgi:glycosyltransferase involved in cell wall biosynthesis
MRVLVLSKRQYTGKDLLDDRYGRLFELPAGLARLGHDVRALVLSYRRKGRLRRAEAGVDWQSVDLVPWPFRYWNELIRTAEGFQPDVIWASSDAIHVVIGARLRAVTGIPLVVDLYDDYEAFGLDRLPGLRSLYRSACRKADGLSVVSESLAEMLRVRGSGSALVEIIGNGVKAGFGQGLDRIASRKLLDLPLDLRLVGTAGSLDASRGIEDLFLAFDSLRSTDPSVRLVVAGPRTGFGEELSGRQVIDLGILPHSQIPVLFSALDVGVVCNRDSAFGRACHPQKLVEMAACGLPVVATSVGEATRLLASNPRNLYVPGDFRMLAQRLADQLDSPSRVADSIASNWGVLALRLEALLAGAYEARSREPS